MATAIRPDQRRILGPGTPLIRSAVMPNVGLQPARAGIAPVTAAGAVTPVTPENTLRGTQINPVTSARTAGMANATTSAVSDVANLNRPAMSQAAQQSAISQVQGGGIRYSGGDRVAPGQAQTQVVGGAAVPAAVDPRVAAAQKTQADAMGQVMGANRGAIAGQARGELGAALAPAQVRGGAAIGAGVGTREATRSSQVDRAVEDMLSRDPAEEERRRREEYLKALGPSELTVGAAVNPQASARLRAEEGRSDSAADALSQLDRSSIAQSRLAEFDTRAAPRIRDLQEQVAANAAKFGRLGQGRTEVEAMRPYTDYLTERAALGHGLAADTAAGEIEDAFRREGVFSGREGQLAAREAGERGERRGERDYATGIARENLERGRDDRRTAIGLGIEGADRGQASAYGRIGTLADLEAQEYGQSAGRRGELRQDRDYETGIEERNVDRTNRARELTTELGEARGEAGIRDILNRYGVAEGAASQAFGEDASLRDEARGERDYFTNLERDNVEREIGVRAGERDEARGERAYRDNLELGNIDRELATRQFGMQFGAGEADRDIADRFGRLGAFSDLEARSRAYDEADLNQLRGERGYQDTLAREAYQDQVNERLMEEEFFGNDFNRSMAQANVGYGDDPVSKYLAAAGQYGDEAEAAFGDLGEMLRVYSMGNAMRDTAAQPQNTVTPGQPFDWAQLIDILGPGILQ